MLVGTEKEGAKKRSLTRFKTTEHRYKQIGNAVAPPVASALGRCLLLTASGKLDTSDAVVRVPDAEMVEVLTEAQKQGLRFYADEIGGARVTTTTELEELISDEESNLIDNE